MSVGTPKRKLIAVAPALGNEEVEKLLIKPKTLGSATSKVNSSSPVIEKFFGRINFFFNFFN